MMRYFAPFLLSLAACSSGPEPARPEKASPAAEAVPAVDKQPEAPAVDRSRVCHLNKEDPNTEAGPYVVQEALGGIKRFAKEAKVLAVLGEPASKSPEREEAATGDIVSEWVWQSGVRITMAGPPQERVASTIVVKAPSKLKTLLGIGIGSTIEEAKKTYADCMEPGQSPSIAQPGINIGSPYDGLYIEADDKGVVSSMALGGAE